MGRSSNIVKQFPAFMRTEEGNGKVLSDISQVLGGNLDERERRMLDILRSHRLNQARHELDLYQLAALLGLNPADFSLLHTFYTAHVLGDRNQRGYSDYLELLRQLIERTVNIFTEGCGTIWSLLEGTSILLAASNHLDDRGRPVLEHPDENIWIDGIYRGGFIHRLAIDYKILESDVLVEKSGYIYLLENPLVDNMTEMKERRQLERINLIKGGFFDTTVAIKIEGIEKRTVFPEIINIATHEGIGFLGTVMQGQTLLFSKDGKVFLDGLDVTERCYYFTNALFDEDRLDQTEINDNFVLVKPEFSINRRFPRPVIMPLTEMEIPSLVLGESEWRFSVREGVFDGDAFNRCVYDLPNSAVELNKLPASGKVQMLWQEHELYAVTLLIPDDLKSIDDFLPDIDLTAWVRAGLERFRAAGVRINVDYYSDDWLIDHSILRNTDALTGDGIYFNGTVI